MRSAAELDERWARNFNAFQRRLELKERAFAYLGGKCRICGYDKCLGAIDFHHVEADKEFNISAKMSWTMIVKELEKCVPLCATCHREVHAGLHPSYVPDPLDWF